LQHLQVKAEDRSEPSAQSFSFLKAPSLHRNTLTGQGLSQGDAQLSKRRFVMPYKQIALALAAMVFASPIYTRPAQGRISSGPLVMIDQFESDGSRPTLDVERIASLQVQ
jgi:hypothetical protein